MDTPQRASRFDHIDGLRGIAVLLVVVYHAWMTSALVNDHTLVGRLISGVLGEGEQGVSLFFVISGFCLAFPVLQRRTRGELHWMDVREFAARRVYRILPPYYAALAMFGATALIFESRRIWPLPQSMNVQPGLGDLLAHALLVQNVTSQPFTINASFWSLGLEWQWYFAFPLMVLAYLRAPRVTIVACGLLALFWGGVLPVLSGRDPWLFRLWLPGRLLEFALGIAAAELLASKRHISRWAGLGVLSFGILVVTTLHVIHMAWLALPMWGLIWAGVVLLSLAAERVRRLLSSRPLVLLGLVSYSVYLLHEPITELVNVVVGTSTQVAALAVILLASAIAIGCGTLFYTVIERPLLQPRMWARFGPHLLRLFGATPVTSDRQSRPSVAAAEVQSQRVPLT